MKFLVISAFLLGCALAEEAPYPPSGSKPQGALLVLPTEVGSASSNQPAVQYSAPQYLVPQPKPEEAENFHKANENVVERIRQEQGSDSGSYYVYLQDGRLQRVQYTTAPLLQTSEQGNKQQFKPSNAQLNAKFQSFSQEQTQSTSREQYRQPYTSNQHQQAASSQYSQLQSSGQYKKQPVSSQYRQEPSRIQYNQAAATSQYRQQPSISQYNQEAASNQYSEQVPIGPQGQQQPKPEKLSQKQQYHETIGQQTDGSQQAEQYSKVQGASGNENSVFTQQQQLYQLQQENQLELQQYLPQPLAATYLAGVQFTEVQPIATPIYSYTPAPLVRILRYAPKYQ